jgi:hypothetical protein
MERASTDNFFFFRFPTKVAYRFYFLLFLTIRLDSRTTFKSMERRQSSNTITLMIARPHRFALKQLEGQDQLDFFYGITSTLCWCFYAFYSRFFCGMQKRIQF